jgi:pimeloyl-ACP methyl ester carboxylesterase
MFFFQIPRLPDALIARGGFAGFAAGIQQDARPGAFTDADMIEYRRAWSQPGAMTAMINWYRAAALPGQNTPPDPRISVPTLMIWGAQDRYLAREMAQASIDLCDDGRLVMIEEATHWVQHEEAEQVNRLIGEFFGDES